MVNLKNFLRISLNRLKSKKQIWKNNLDSEVNFWYLYVHGKTKWSKNIENRLDPNSPFPEHLRDYIDRESSKIKVLDVGAGPLSNIGIFWQNGPEIELSPIDPLADKYDLLLSKAGIQSRVKTIYCEGEKITKKFQKNFFDLVHASNSIDHSYEPVKCFQEMFSVLKNNCYIYAVHHPNEGQNENYRGLHQWNFDIINSNFCIWNENSQFFLKDYLPQEAKISAKFSETMVRTKLSSDSSVVIKAMVVGVGFN